MANFSELPSTFENIKTYLTQKIIDRFPALKVFLENSFINIFLDLIAYGIELFMTISSNNINENSLIYTTNYENARIKAQFYGHKASRQKSATGTIKVGLDENFSTSPTENITFSKWDRIVIAGTPFLISEAVTITTSDTSVTLNVIQGEKVDVTKTAKGDQNEEYEVNDPNIENDNYYVYVNDTLWEEVDSFFASTGEDEHYTTEPLTQMTGLKTIFGDNFLGKNLTAGDSVLLQYVKTKGLSGQVKSNNLPVTFLETYTYTDTTEVEFYGITTSLMEGADDYESLESLKYFGQISTSSMDDKAFNNDELELELQEFGGILKSKSYGEYDNSPDTPDFLRANIIELLIIPEGGGVLGDLKKGEIRSYLRNRTDWTDFFRFIDPEYINVRFILDMEVFNNVYDNFAADIDTLLQTTYSLDNSDFGIGIDHSDVIYLIQDNFNSYIKRFNLNMRVVEDFSTAELATYPTHNKFLLIGDLRSGVTNIPYCQLTITYTDMADDEQTEIVDASEGESVFTLPDGDPSVTLSSSSFEEISGEINLTFNDGVTIKAVTSIEAQYATYDVDGVDLNIDIKYNQVSLHTSSSVTLEVVT